jgi:predicted acylesterase/phospholipase RssA
MKKYMLGDKVRVRRIIEAEKRWDREARHTKRKWVPKEQQLSGIVIGHRYVREGIVDYWPDSTFTPEKYIECYLVAYDLHRKPVHVLPEDMEVVSD